MPSTQSSPRPLPPIPSNENFPPQGYGRYLGRLLTTGLHRPDTSNLHARGNWTANPPKAQFSPRGALDELRAPTSLVVDVLPCRSRKVQSRKSRLVEIEVWDDREGTLPGRRLQVWIALHLQATHGEVQYREWRSEHRLILFQKMDLNEQILSLGGNVNIYTHLPSLSKMKEGQTKPWLRDLRKYMHGQRKNQPETPRKVNFTQGEIRAEGDWAWLPWSFVKVYLTKYCSSLGQQGKWGALEESNVRWGYRVLMDWEMERDCRKRGLRVSEIDGNVS